MLAYRIRVGEQYFSLPHYIVKTPTNDSASTDDVKALHKAKPMLWSTRKAANNALSKIILLYPSAKIERIDLDLED